MASFLGLRSGRTKAGTSSPSRDADDTAALFEGLRVLESQLEREEEESYSLVDEVSKDGSRARGLESRRAYSGPPLRSLGAPAGSGAGGESIFTTPLRQGGSRRIQSGGVSGLVQDQGLGSRVSLFKTSPTSTKDRSRMSSSPSAPGVNSKLLGHVFVDAEFVKNKCCGYIGKSDFFCLRDRVPENGYKSCQTLSHADRRFTPAEDSFYAPIGLHYNTPAANSLKVVNINDLSNVQQARIMDASYTRAVWDRLFDEVTASGRVGSLGMQAGGPPAVVNVSVLEAHDATVDQVSLPYMSPTVSVGSGDLSIDGERLEPVVQELGLEDEMEDAQMDVQGAIRQLREDTARGFRDWQDHMRRIIAEETGDLPFLLERYGSIAGYFEAATAEPFRLMEENIHNAMVDLEDRLNRNQAGPSLVKLFRQLVGQVDRRHGEVEARLRDLEQQVTREDGIISSRSGMNASEEMVDIAGRKVPASMVVWVQMLRDVESRVEVLTARAKNSGVSIGDMTFASELDLQGFWMKHDASGYALAACVDFVSLIQAFGSSESLTTQDFLSTSEKSKKVNLRAGEGGFAASFRVRHLEIVAGKASSIRISSSVTLPIFKDWQGWIGNGHAGDGFKENITRMVNHACTNHRQYLDDADLPDELRSLALKTAELARQWWMDLATYLDNEFLMLENYGLAVKQILLLLSNQMVQIFEDIADKRGPAGNTDISNRPKAAVRYAWATLQAHSVMAAYRDAKFRDHPAIAGTFIRFLTRNLASQSSLGLGSVVESLEKEVKKLKQELDKKVTLDAYNRFEAKVNKALPKAGGSKE